MKPVEVRLQGRPTALKIRECQGTLVAQIAHCSGTDISAALVGLRSRLWRGRQGKCEALFLVIGVVAS